MDLPDDFFKAEILPGFEPEEAQPSFRAPHAVAGDAPRPHAKFRRLRRHGHSLFALAQCLVGLLAGQRIGKDLRQQLQAPHLRRRPVAFGPRGIEAQNPDRRPAAHRQREALNEETQE